MTGSLSLPKISIVTPSYNQGEYLEECLDSVLSQGYPNLEYIVMDGGSRDNSVEIIRKYEKHLTYWQSQPDGGQYAAIDEGFRRTSGGIMSWLNSDDIFHPGALQLAARIFTQRQDIRWLTNRPNGFTSRDVPGYILYYLPRYCQERYLLKDFKDPFIQQEGTFWRRSLWEEAGARMQTDLHLAGDLELWTRFFRHAGLHSVDTCLACFRPHPGKKGADLGGYFAEADRILDDELQRFISAPGSILRPPPPPVTSAPDAIREVWTLGHCPEFPPTVSVVLTTLDNTEGLDKAIGSLRQQDGVFLELIIVDLGRGKIADRTKAACQGLATRYLSIQPATGFAAGCNGGISLTRGKFLAFLHDTDRLQPGHMASLLGIMQRDGAKVAYAAASLACQDYSPDTHSGFDPQRLLRENYIPLSAVVLERSCLDAVGLLDESLGAFADWDFLMRLSRCYAFGHSPEPTCCYAPRSATPLPPTVWHGLTSPSAVIGRRGKLYGMQRCTTVVA